MVSLLLQQPSFKNVSNKKVTTVGENGPDGADHQLLQTLAEKFHFKLAFKVADGFVDAVNIVSIDKYSSISRKKTQVR